MKIGTTLIGLLALFCSLGCQPSSESQSVKLIPASQFDATIDNKLVSLYTLKNSAGTVAQVTNFGGRIVALWSADREGEMEDVVLGYESIDRYINHGGERFFGATIGRYGNRIANGKFTLNGEEYRLATYNRAPTLHGGPKGFDMVVWDVVSVSDNTIHLSYLSKDMEEGFPGNLSVNMIYSLTEDNEFKIEYFATTDKDTPINLTNHSFFNLKGEGNGTINDHILYIAADNFTPVDKDLIPTGEIATVKGTPLDFTTPVAIGSRLGECEADCEQLSNCRGYDHNFVLNRKSDSDVELAATLFEPESGRYLEVWTSEPGMQFYGGNFFKGNALGKSGKPLKYREALALETQHFPDSPNQPNFPSTILKPGEEYHQICIYKLGVR